VAGYREFQTGEVLTAANVNDFLMNQSVMVFADATARTSALSGVVAEGMLTYNKDTAQLEVYDGSAFVVAAPVVAGIGSNVVQTVKTDTFTTTSATFVDVTGLTVTITPTTATSKILLVCTLNVGGNAVGAYVRLVDGSNTPLVLGNAASGRVQASGGARVIANTGMLPVGVTFLWSPATASAVTAKIQLREVGGALVAINRQGLDDTDYGRYPSSITAIEVAP
jgi:hypothetical protein